MNLTDDTMIDVAGLVPGFREDFDDLDDGTMDAFEHEDSYSLAQLKGRGWTSSSIRTLLGEPDSIAENPFNSKSPIKLYRVDRVHAAEADSSFSLTRRGPASQDTKAKLKGAWARRKAAALDAINDFQITVEQMTPEELTARVIASRNECLDSVGLDPDEPRKSEADVHLHNPEDASTPRFRRHRTENVPTPLVN